jgi:hypothetical protein
LTPAELQLVTALLRRSGKRPHLSEALTTRKVRPLPDGGMGSLRFDSPGQQHLGEQVAELEFVDSDGVAVSASLNVDERGDLYELDLFKANFAPLIALPDEYPES